jgi:hypothetical protein
LDHRVVRFDEEVVPCESIEFKSKMHHPVLPDAE